MAAKFDGHGGHRNARPPRRARFASSRTPPPGSRRAALRRLRVMPPYVAVIGAGRATPEEARTAEAVGRGLAEGGAVLVCGGLGGVMEAACRGAKEAGGSTVGILPGPS